MDKQEGLHKPAILQFLPNWEQTQDGDIIAGLPCQVYYTSSRMLPERRPPDENGHRLWSIVMKYKYPPSETVMSQIGKSDCGHEILDCTITIPENVSELELWFVYADAFGQLVLDSRFGINYHFRVSKSE